MPYRLDADLRKGTVNLFLRGSLPQPPAARESSSVSRDPLPWGGSQVAPVVAFGNECKKPRSLERPTFQRKLSSNANQSNANQLVPGAGEIPLKSVSLSW